MINRKAIGNDMTTKMPPIIGTVLNVCFSIASLAALISNTGRMIKIKRA